MTVLYLKRPVKESPREKPDFSALTPGARLVAEIRWRKANPPPPLISGEGLMILEHDPAQPQWRRPIVWSGESERQARALASKLCFERLPFSLEELIVWGPYVAWLIRAKERSLNYPVEARAGLNESAAFVAYQYLPGWAPGITAFLHDDLTTLTALHKGDPIYQQLQADAGAELEDAFRKALEDATPQ